MRWLLVSLALLAGPGCSGCEDPQPLEGVVGVSVGWAHTCAVTEAGHVWCWGGNDRGQLGVGEGDDAEHAVAVRAVDEVEMVSASLGTCALRRDGAVWCWGVPWLEPHARPARVEGLCEAERVVTGARTACALCRDATLQCWGERASRPVRVEGWEHVAQLAVGAAHACAITQTREVECLRLDAILDGRRVEPTAVPMPASVRSLSAAGQTICAVVEDVGVQCWSAADPAGRVTVELPRARAVSVASATEACALTAQVTATCWRMELAGEGGDRLALSEGSVRRRELTFTTEEISAGPSARCARTRQERVYCWAGDAEPSVVGREAD